MRRLVWIITILIVTIAYFLSRDFNSRYERSINGDAKGYYAYLPALFIYQDPNYTFVDKMEKKYYPEDGSHIKNFRNKQKNGKYVNKCFPGLSLLYLPFFILAAIFAWIAGIPIDGYSLPFQVGIGLAHLFYLFSGLFLLYRFFLKNKQSKQAIWIVFITLVFGTNIWFYLIHDHTVSHIFNFFLASLFIWLVQKWIETKNMKWVGLLGILLALLVIVRPTNAMMILFIPLIFLHCEEDLISFIRLNFKWRKTIIFLPFAGLVLFIPPLLWKWQSDLWLVYSYNEEGFNFFDPNFTNFLFSYKKGWLLWTPIMLVFIGTSSLYYFRKSFRNGLLFLLPLLIVTYVLSSWWCWTYGAGMSQRAMIDYYPFIALGTVSFLHHVSHKKTVFLILFPLIGLNLLQNYQIANGILSGGETTSSDYWNHFLQWKTNPPSVKIGSNWKLIDSKFIQKSQDINNKNHFSSLIESDTLNGINTIVVELEIGGKHGDPNLCLVLTSKDGKFYKSFNFGYSLYQTPRKIAFGFDVRPDSNQVYHSYVWNGDTKSQARINTMKVNYYSH